MSADFRQRLMTYMTGNLTCRQTACLVTDYLEGVLPWTTVARFHMHIGMCFACRNYLAQIKYTVQVLRQLPPEPIPTSIRDELIRRFRDWTS